MGARQRAQHRPNGKGSNKGSPWSQKKSNSSLQGNVDTNSKSYLDTLSKNDSVQDLDPSIRHRALLQGWQDFASSASSPSRTPMTMGQEARNTERHAFGWSNTKLRAQGITFVSAGTLSREEPVTTKNSTSDESLEENEPVDTNVSLPLSENEGENMRTDVPVVKKEAGEGNEVQEVDAGVVDSSMTYRQRKDSSASSLTSEEILFTGRQPSTAIPVRNRKKAIEQLKPPSPPNSNPVKTLNARPQISPPLDSTQTPQLSTSSDYQSTGNTHRMNSRFGRRGIPKHIRERMEEEEAIMQDYIANMAVDDDEEEDEDETSNDKPVRRNEHYRYFNGSGNENVKVQMKNNRPVRRTGQLFDQAADWSSADMEDFDDLSTTDDEIMDIGQVLRQRQRPSGVQYLVTAIGKGAGDAKWILQEKLISSTAKEEIRIYEEIQAIRFEEISDDDESDSDEEDDEALDDLIKHIESEDEENARIFEHTSRMTDEQIARALAKQEELGLGGDELMLFDGQVDDDDEESIEDEFAGGDGFVPFSMKQHISNRTRSKRNRRERDSFPSAAAFADALEQDPYGAFDVMDFDRPSLRSKRKGRKSGFPYDLELEDEDLKEQLTSTWARDREKKMTRKREKEEARLNMMFEESERSEPAVIKAEIRRFLMQEIDSLRLAPMDAGTRASVHRLAKVLKLSSRSEGKEGKGAGRYPVLTKTAHTPHYQVDNIWEVDALMNQKRFFPKHGGNVYKRGKAASGMTMRRGGGGGGTISGAIYMNGEVVGASAPELGADNRGRAMLEKMGWTKGMAIGAIGNKGSLEAVKHVVKTTKAGLG